MLLHGMDAGWSGCYGIVQKSLPFIVPCIVSLSLVPLFRWIAHKTGILDIPNGTLKVHAQPTAYLGGVAIYCAALVSYLWFPPFFSADHDFLFFYGTGITLLVLAGLVDDILAISPFKKLLFQGVACLFFIRADLFFKASVFQALFPFLPHAPFFFSILGIVLSLWWMLAIINAVNLIDIMDGLATSVSILALWGMCVVWVSAGGIVVDPVFLPLLGVLVGFCFYNKPKASIYLGDAGSLLLGGILATTPFLFGWGKVTQWSALVVPFCILFVPIFELCSLMVIRTYLGIPFYHGSPHHFALCFKRRGWGVKKILRVTACLGALCSFLGVVLVFDFPVLLKTTFFLFFGGLFFLSFCLF